MNTFNLGRLFGVWCALMLCLPVGISWLRADFAPGHLYIAAMKLAVLLAIACSGGLVVALGVARRWSSTLREFNRFVLAFPASETELPAEGPPEIQSLARSMHGMAGR